MLAVALYGRKPSMPALRSSACGGSSAWMQHPLSVTLSTFWCQSVLKGERCSTDMLLMLSIPGMPMICVALEDLTSFEIAKYRTGQCRACAVHCPPPGNDILGESMSPTCSHSDWPQDANANARLAGNLSMTIHVMNSARSRLEGICMGP